MAERADRPAASVGGAEDVFWRAPRAGSRRGSDVKIRTATDAGGVETEPRSASAGAETREDATGQNSSFADGNRDVGCAATGIGTEF